MKRVFFILLAFISFQGVSQSVKIQEIGLEVMTEDLGEMDWYEATKACADLGDGWRLPTMDELHALSNHYWSDDDTGSFRVEFYWSSTEKENDDVYVYEFGREREGWAGKETSLKYVRAIRSF